MMTIVSVIVSTFLKHKYSSLAGVVFAVAVSLFYKKTKKCPKKQKKKEYDDRGFTEVLFFSSKNSLCQAHLHEVQECEKDCNYLKLTVMIEYLDSAKESIDVCVYTISSFKLAEAVVRKFHQGVKVRIITDDSMAYGDASQILLFRKNGILVRTRMSHYLMHHKFAIIDEKILINGSFNWTQQATLGNWENVVIASRPESMVKSFCDHFNELWNELE